MIRDIITNKWIIGAVLLLIIIACGCYVWYQYELLPYKHEPSKTLKYTPQLENTKKAKTDSRAKVKIDQTAQGATPNAAEPMPNAAKPVNEIIPNPENAAQSETHEPVTTHAAQADDADKRVSPYGFGPFPKIPAGYPGGEDPNFWTYDWDKNGELVHRVLMKLWNEGTQAIGATISNGLVYPNYPHTLIIEWKTQQTPFGTRKVARSIQGSPETETFLQNHDGPLYESDIPSDIKVIEHKEAGIDPYEFLDLPR